MSINPASSAAVNSGACTWITNTARSASDAVIAGATKIANLVAVAFRALAQYASSAVGYLKEGASIGMNAMKANPQMAVVGGLGVLTVAAIAAYAYKQHSAAV